LIHFYKRFKMSASTPSFSTIVTDYK